MNLSSKIPSYDASPVITPTSYAEAVAHEGRIGRDGRRCELEQAALTLLFRRLSQASGALAV